MYPRVKRMTKQIGIKIEPQLLQRFQSFARQHGINLSALMRQATIAFINANTIAVPTEFIPNGQHSVCGAAYNTLITTTIANDDEEEGDPYE